MLADVPGHANFWGNERADELIDSAVIVEGHAMQ